MRNLLYDTGDEGKASLFTLLIALAASRSQAQTGVLGCSVSPSDPNATISHNADGSISFGIISSASGGHSETHNVTLSWQAVVNDYRPHGDGIASSLNFIFDERNSASCSVSLAGLTPPSGGGKATGSISIADTNTGFVSRQTTPVTSSLSVVLPKQGKSVTVPVEWTFLHPDTPEDGYIVATVVFEVDKPATSAQIDAYPTDGTTTTLPGPGGPGGITGPGPVPSETANGSASQTVKLTSVSKAS